MTLLPLAPGVPNLAPGSPAMTPAGYASGSIHKGYAITSAGLKYGAKTAAA